MYEKYITALRLMDAVISVKDAPTPPEGWMITPRGYDPNDLTKKERAPGILHPVNLAWDELFTFVHSNFETPVSAARGRTDYKEEYDLCRPFIDGTYRAPSQELEGMIRSIPPVILDVVWPVSIARLLLRDHSVPFNHRLSTTFKEFHDRYGHMILSC